MTDNGLASIGFVIVVIALLVAAAVTNIWLDAAAVAWTALGL